MSKPVDKVGFWKERIDTAAKDYFTVYVTSEGNWHEINKVHVKLLEKYIKPTDKVLDAGCAYARMARFFLPENYVGVDFSPDFIKLAKKNNPGNTFVQADLKKLPFKGGEFDWAFCISIKKMVEDNLGKEEWNRMERELTRVAKKLLVLEYESPEPHEIIEKDKRTCYEDC